MYALACVFVRVRACNCLRVSVSVGVTVGVRVGTMVMVGLMGIGLVHHHDPILNPDPNSTP